jgi:hypothetical protein
MWLKRLLLTRDLRNDVTAPLRCAVRMRLEFLATQVRAAVKLQGDVFKLQWQYMQNVKRSLQPGGALLGNQAPVAILGSAELDSIWNRVRRFVTAAGSIHTSFVHCVGSLQGLPLSQLTFIEQNIILNKKSINSCRVMLTIALFKIMPCLWIMV